MRFGEESLQCDAAAVVKNLGLSESEIGKFKGCFHGLILPLLRGYGQLNPPLNGTQERDTGGGVYWPRFAVILSRREQVSGGQHEFDPG